MRFCTLLLLLASPVFAIHVEDEARVLAQSTRQQIETLAAGLSESSGIQFLLKTGEARSLSGFEQDALSTFAGFIQKVDGARGVMLFIQMEKGSRKGRINFSMGSGLEGALGRDEVRRILDNRVLSFRQDLKQQDELVSGIAEYFGKLEEWAAAHPPGVMLPPPDPSGAPPSPARFLKSWPWIIGILLAGFIIGLALFAYGRRSCPRCGSRLTVSIKPLSHSDGRFRKIKITKCFECNYFRKYLF